MLSSSAAVILAYLVGTIPTALIVARRSGYDVTGQGSGNPGASNTYRVAGRRAGAQVLVGDMLKGVLASAGGYAVGGRHLGFICGIAAVVGHCYPMTRGFRGGKGVATTAGVSVVMFPAIAAACALIFAATAKVRRTASLASMASALTLVIGVIAFGRPLWEVAAVLVMVGLVLVRHRTNLERLVRGEEEVIP